MCRACALYYGPDGRVAGARVQALLLARGFDLPIDDEAAARAPGPRRGGGVFFFIVSATSDIYFLSLDDAVRIWYLLFG